MGKSIANSNRHLMACHLLTFNILLNALIELLYTFQNLTNDSFYAKISGTHWNRIDFGYRLACF